MRRAPFTLSAFFGLALVPSLVRAQTVITTIPVNATFTANTASLFGQTFTAPADNVLTSFAFQLDQTAPLTLSVYAYAPVTNTTIGLALFTSAPAASTTVQGLNGYAFNTGSLVLTAGSVYAALLSGVTGYSGVDDGNFNGVDYYAGGTLIVGNNTTGPFRDFSVLFGTPVDTAFQATFIPSTFLPSTPEPGSVALLIGLGVSGAGFLARRRKPRQGGNTERGGEG